MPSLAADYDALAGAAAKLGALSGDLGDQAGPIRAAPDAAARAASALSAEGAGLATDLRRTEPCFAEAAAALTELARH